MPSGSHGRSRGYGTDGLLGTSASPEVASRAVTGTAVAGWRFGVDTQVDRRSGTYTNNVHQWLSDYLSGAGGAGANLEDWLIRATKLSGDNPNVGNALGSWHSFRDNATVNWEQSNGVNGTTRECHLLIEVKHEYQSDDVAIEGHYYIYAEDTGGGTTTTTTPTSPTTFPPSTSLPPSSL